MFGQTTAQPAPAKPVANIDANTIATNQNTIPVPYFAGRCRLVTNYISPPYNIRDEPVTQKTGKDTTSTVGYTRYGDYATTLACVGRRLPIDSIHRIIKEGEIVWEGTITRDTDFYEAITVTDFGVLRFYWGYPAQPRDAVITPIGAPPTDPGFDPRRTSTWPNGDRTANIP